MTPRSAAQSNAAAREAGWYASTWDHAQISALVKDKCKSRHWRSQIKDLLATKGELITNEISQTFLLGRNKAKERLNAMLKEGTIKHRYVNIEGRRHSAWRLAK
jgi:predicted ArsR family transcriptional regulator